ncbi:hypothetical protein WCX49_02995 [Sulfurimonas sp. HSL-1656]|uniref:hypothetical protein n=1 Tax=Thiomicrolovo subterrani TaxID=3131934 RepID=UPI0031F7CB42
MSLAYSAPKPLHVKWNRLLNGALLVAAVFSEQIELLYIFLALNIVTLVVSIRFGPARWLLALFEKHLKGWLDVPAAYERSYAMTAATERFEIGLRLLAGTAVLLLYPCCPLAAWLITVGMGIFMLISAFFGFCLSSFGLIGLHYVRKHCCVRS